MIQGRAGERAVVWDRPELRALCPPAAIPYDAPDSVTFPGGSRFQTQTLYRTSLAKPIALRMAARVPATPAASMMKSRRSIRSDT